MQNAPVTQTETNERTVRDLYDALSNGDLARLEKLFAADFPGGAAGFRTVIEELRASFPDIHYTVTDLLTGGDRVAVRFRWTGTSRQPFRGFPATGKAVESGGFAFFTLRGGLISSSLLDTDRLGFLQQLGVVPPDAIPQAGGPRRESLTRPGHAT